MATLLYEQRTKQAVQRVFSVASLAALFADEGEVQPGDFVRAEDSGGVYLILKPGGGEDSVVGVAPGPAEPPFRFSGSIGAPVGTSQVLTLSVSKPSGEAGQIPVTIWLADASDDLTPTSAPPADASGVTTGTVMVEITEDIAWIALPDEGGEIEVTLDNAGGSDPWEGFVVVSIGDTQKVFGPFEVPETA